MKSILYKISIIFLLISISTVTNAQEKSSKYTTSKFMVKGVCDDCKERIENGALIKGVKFAEWDKEKQEITVIFNAKKTSLDEIHKAIAEVGYDTDKIKASKEAYAKLPACCAYNDGVEKH